MWRRRSGTAYLQELNFVPRPARECRGAASHFVIGVVPVVAPIGLRIFRVVALFVEHDAERPGPAAAYHPHLIGVGERRGPGPQYLVHCGRMALERIAYLDPKMRVDVAVADNRRRTVRRTCERAAATDSPLREEVAHHARRRLGRRG